MFLRSATVIFIAHLVKGYPYSSYSSKRYNQLYGPAYVPAPVTYGFNQNRQVYDSQPESNRAYWPSYYYPYHSDRTDRGMAVSYDDASSELPEDMDYQSVNPYGQELWYEGGPDAAANAAAAATREAILQNLVIAQMYEDAAASAAVNGFPLYQMPAEDYSKDYKYGVPTTDIDEKERARQYLMKNDADEDVKELENLQKIKETNNSKDGRRRRKQKNKGQKSSQAPETSDIVKRSETGTAAKLDEVAASLSPNTIGGGQKEVVLPQPARTRRPLTDLEQRLHARSEQPSVYQTIKELLALESNHKTDTGRIQKRFVSTEEQLTKQLNSLKRAAMKM